MTDRTSASVLRQLRFVVASWKEDTRTDVELLRRFAQTRDEQAFTTIVGRHSDLVWGVCLRVLRNSADAEDALQATFLRLARDAGRVVNRESLAGWLFRVARDCSVDLLRSIVRQRRIEERVAEVAHRGDENPATDLRVLLDDELAQLPPSERAVLVMCCLEGRTYADAALELGCSTAAVHRRFLRAQTRLRKRFARRKAATGAVGILLGANIPAASAAPPVGLARVVECGLAVATTGALPATRAGVLATAAATTVGRAVLGPAVAAAALLVAASVISIVFAGAPRNTAEPSAPDQSGAVVQQVEGSNPEGRPRVTGVVRGPDGRPVAGVNVAALARRPFRPGERGMCDDLLATTATDATGRFSLAVPADFATWFTTRVVTVQASGLGLAPATAPVHLRPGPFEVELVMAPASALRGRLLGADGRPIADVRVEVVRIGDAVAEPVIGVARATPPDWPEPATSAADGTFCFPTLGGCANVWVRVSGPRVATHTFRVDGSARDFTLDAALPFEFTVRAGGTGATVAGARVTVVTDRIRAHPHFASSDSAVQGPRTVPGVIDAVTGSRGEVALNVARGDRLEVLIHPPTGDEPLVGVRLLVPTAEPAVMPSTVELPRGRWVTGTVTDSAGRPVSGAVVHWGREDATKPEWKDDILVGRDALTHTAPDGTFRIAVLPGLCSLRIYGPTLDHPPIPARVPGSSNSTLYAHAVMRFDVPAVGNVPPVQVAIPPGVEVQLRVEHPSDAESSAFVLCAGRVSPVRPYSSLALPVCNGTIAVPGCRTGVTTRAYVLDPVARVGGVIDVTPGATSPTLKLAPCGTVQFRVLDAAGNAVPDLEVKVALLTDRDRAAGEPAASDAQPTEWFDPVNYARRPTTDLAGRVELPALIPGASYEFTVGTRDAKVPLGRFTIASGVTTLPNVIIPSPGGVR